MKNIYKNSVAILYLIIKCLKAFSLESGLRQFLAWNILLKAVSQVKEISIRTRKKEIKLSAGRRNNCNPKISKISAGQKYENFKNNRRKYTMMALWLGVGKEFFCTTQNSQMIKGKEWSIWLHENEQFCSPKDNRDEAKNLIIVLGEDIFIWKHITIKHVKFMSKNTNNSKWKKWE